MYLFDTKNYSFHKLDIINENQAALLPTDLSWCTVEPYAQSCSQLDSVIIFGWKEGNDVPYMWRIDIFRDHDLMSVTSLEDISRRFEKLPAEFHRIAEINHRFFLLGFKEEDHANCTTRVAYMNTYVEISID